MAREVLHTFLSARLFVGVIAIGGMLSSACYCEMKDCKQRGFVERLVLCFEECDGKESMARAHSRSRGTSYMHGCLAA